ncbi:alpha-glucan family phosphorylase [Paludibacter sp. 221]|uniref:alpha-glucan family phosphorylase n=1 Tax=Paludibacter sp. 221 TaxID=2302939 RepID=UPI0013D0DF53|nr:alpha-glucan family phosphorylase [Paludibacter sp. 221]NDV47648.1 alpha-glucan family phosphorylase [Paludibacter sp. 221]
MKIKVNEVNETNWRDINVKSNLPENLKKLEEIAYNIWWCWDSEARDLFRNIDRKAWKEASSNPVQLFNVLNYKQMTELSNDESFLKKLDKVYDSYKNYLAQPYDTQKPSVAYFSMEYGLTEVLKIYSGGLGVLAGDYLKEASDSHVDMTAVGFLYRYGYFTQSLSMEGQQIAVYEPQNFNNLPIKQVKDENDNPVVVEVPYPGRTIYTYVWQVKVGRISLYLLDTDNDMNSEFDRSITHQLYGGDWENRLKQEYMLGIGGILTLKKLGVEKQVYHCNEGHAALINVQRLVDLIAEKGLSFDQAMEVVRSSSLYTVHTPVPAGHDSFDEGLFGKYMSEYPSKLNISWNDFIDMGREHPGNHDEKFSMSTFACNTCQEVNGVSWLHGKVSQKMFQPIWKGYFPEELHVSYVTNGVHLPTWAASEWKKIYEKYFTPAFYEDQSNLKIWQKIYEISDQEIWDTRMGLKSKLIDYIRQQFQESWFKSQGDPKAVVSILESINPNALIIGFGRRFATYKRAHLLFTDLERLEKIVNDPQRPVQFLFTGKAHPADGGGQGLIKRIIEISRMPQFLGKIIFLENYDMRLAKRLVSGVDIWLNTPTRPLEASGTSGEKAQMNGVLNFSVLDGWWLEGYVKGAGWALTDKRTYENQTYQDQLDAATIYNMLESEIIPLFFARNTKGYSPEWIQYIKKSFAEITPRFTTKRMIDDYINRFYSKLAKRSALLKDKDFAKAKEIAAWKEKMAQGWNDIEVVAVDLPENLIHNPHVGENYNINIVVDTKKLNDNGVGIELVITNLDSSNNEVLCDVQELKLVKTEGSKLYFNIDYQLNMAGSFKYSFRMFPKNEDLPHRQDFCYVRWI